MKRIFFNKAWLGLTLCVGVIFTSCLKDKGFEDNEYGAVRNTEGGKFVSIRGAGLTNFTKSNLQINTSKTDTIRYDVFVDLDYAVATTSPVTVTLALDNSKIATYNAANSKNFQPVTNDMIKLLNSTLTIPAGERTAKTTLEVYQNKFDPAKSYLIPLTIMTADGATLSSNLNTRYINIIGNPLAGTYTVVGKRYNYSGVISYSGGAIPTGYGSTANSPNPKTASPVDEQTISIDYANLGGSGYQYLIKLDPANPNRVIVS
ncbi:MAG TPA: DUF1735 domain-containing protein, partial [Chitinophagaceae bacterium]|nr:DUF1735 domain-containing protein [Chitinophagaceae bacterium]